MSANDNRKPRWRAVLLYRSIASDFVDVEYFFEEIHELESLIERGPHWDTLIRCTITLNRHAENANLTIEEAAQL